MKATVQYNGLVFLSSLLLFLFPLESVGQRLLELKNDKTENYIGRYVEILDAETGEENFQDVLKSSHFKNSTSVVPNFKVSSLAHWIKFTAINLSGKTDFIVQLSLATIDYIDYYAVYEDNHVDSVKTGDCRPFGNREYGRPDFTFKFSLNKNEKIKIFFKVRGGEQVQAPVNVGERTLMLMSFFNTDILIGIYFGVILVMILYNTFVFFSTKDQSYLFYVVYILIVGLTQLNFLGYANKYFWPNSIFISNIAVYILSSLTAITSMEFMKRFLFTKVKCPGLHKYFIVFYIFYYVAMALALVKQFNWSYQIIQINATLAASYILWVAWKISRQGYRPAKFFLVAWSTFLVGVCVFVFKDLGMLPYNNITYYTMPVGSACEVILLSFALADRINILKKEKEESQTMALEALKENEKIVTEQNIMLERKVKERTVELETSNKNLKDTQSQLVNAEKMASLGQLTAGIAHEINNPINFVISNVKPLKRDIEEILLLLTKYSEIQDDKDLSERLKGINELKEQLDTDYLIQEINLLLKGIDEGASRTSEIVKGLQNFSRLDEDDLKLADVHEGINSTLAVLNSNIIKGGVNIVKEYGKFPPIECYPGKLNQVFMNILNNAIQAIVSNKTDQGEIKIKTALINEKKVRISIKDNGPGMTENVKNRIFEPFFTTKNVGEGSGLGLSIVYGIIEKHKGEISVESAPGKGTEFIILLPV